jgi:opacity protein-like surface antigen
VDVVGNRVFACVLASILLSPAAAVAEQGSQVGSDIELRGWGLRAGLGVDPDQVLFGFHWDLGEFVENLRFQPDVELGLGDDTLTIYGTAPVHYLFDIDGTFTPYAGGGLVIGVVSVDRPERAGGDDTSFEGGARAIGGLQWVRKNGKPFAVEGNFGVGDVHDLQIKVLWTF